MSLQKLVANYAGYNLWANRQLVNWLSEKPVEQLNQEVPSSFSSVLKTLNHIWAIEEYWYAIITQTTDFENRYGIEQPDAEEVFKGLINRSGLLAQAVASLTESELAQDIKVDSPWYKAERPRYEFVQHIVNHGTYHRGQVVTIGRNAGLTDAPGTDFIFFPGE